MPDYKLLKIKPEDKEKYIMADEKDYEILAKIYELEEKGLSDEDKESVNLIRTQLERDWRDYLIEILDKLLEKYK